MASLDRPLSHGLDRGAGAHCDIREGQRADAYDDCRTDSAPRETLRVGSASASASTCAAGEVRHRLGTGGARTVRGRQDSASIGRRTEGMRQSMLVRALKHGIWDPYGVHGLRRMLRVGE